MKDDESQALRAALAELVACRDMADECLTLRSDPYYITQADAMEINCYRRTERALEVARRLLGK